MMLRSKRPPEDCVRGLKSRVALLVEMEPRGRSLYDRGVLLKGHGTSALLLPSSLFCFLAVR